MNRTDVCQIALCSTLIVFVVELLLLTLFSGIVFSPTTLTMAGSTLTTARATLTTHISVDKVCDELPTTLVGRIYVNNTVDERLTWQQLEGELSNVPYGGEWRPQNSSAHCLPRHVVAIIVPYMSREPQLLVFLRHIHRFLQRQQIHYCIYVVEQANTTKEFNKGRLMNAGFEEAMRQHHWSCVIFHDVDVLPEDDRNIYHCDNHYVRHMTTAVDRYNYTVGYAGHMGGVAAFKPEQYRKVNGYSNLFWLWGGEDDDMRFRLNHHKMPVKRPLAKFATYTTVRHEHAKKSKDSEKVLRMKKYGDGLKTLRNYMTIVRFEKRPLYHWILVDVGPFTPTIKTANKVTRNVSTDNKSKAKRIQNKSKSMKNNSKPIKNDSKATKKRS
ncbi:PREDICTED: beta-1,4-galactosyltransferase 4-like isoform X2 [Priapulus caudatus]|uniref:Beta-1,4-N-acetylgalactosaminyltransferase n=1 Tax=Priapulus caudatus TaxID=37621 RepID=A0ABM1EYH3_PRICU|nr:PREDICTED: beta-1,4-galactosyltransferase 4-like isoform X2 [Priapulus caudatus]